MSGKVVIARILNNGTMCGALSRATGGGLECTLGGLIRVGGSMYALTTAHGLLGSGNESSTSFTSTGMSQWVSRLQMLHIFPMLMWDNYRLSTCREYPFIQVLGDLNPPKTRFNNLT
jgi:hypothetical protein